jgi:hypothetical protein
MTAVTGWYPAARDIANRMYKPPTGTPKQSLQYITDVETLLTRLNVAVVSCMTITEINTLARELRIYDALIHLIRDNISEFVPPPY